MNLFPLFRAAAGIVRRTVSNRTLPVLLTLLSASASPLQAIMLPLSTPKLIDMSDRIVEGRITGMTGRWTDDRSAIVTEVTLEPTDVLLGENEPLTFLIEGGKVGGVEQWVSDMPTLKQDEPVFVFLRNPSAAEKERDHSGDKGRYYVLAGAAQGLHHISKGRALKGGFSVLGDNNIVEANLDLQDLKDRVRRQLETRRRESTP